MKTLKITLLLAAVVLLTVSGTSSAVVNDNTDETKSFSNEEFHYQLIAHKRKGGEVPSNG
jgi:hypothetical protein